MRRAMQKAFMGSVGITLTAAVTWLGAGPLLAGPLGAFASSGGSSKLVLLAQNAPSSSNPLPSLGELARKLRQEREAQGTKAVKVYTNDTIPQHGGLALTVATPKSSPSGTSKSKPAAQTSKKHGEAYFQKRAKRIRSDLNLHERELAVLKQQLAQAQITYYPNPQKTLQEESGPGFQSSANKLRQEIQSKEAQIAADHKAMQELEQQLQREGGDPGWIR